MKTPAGQPAAPPVDSSLDRYERGAIRAAYRRALEALVRFHVPAGSSVLELGCGRGDLLAALSPSRGVGVDVDPQAIAVARERHPELDLRVGDVQDLQLAPDERFDVVLMSNLVQELDDVQQTFAVVRSLCTPTTRVVITFFNYLWQPAAKIAEWLGLKPRQRELNWLTQDQLRNLLELSDLEVVCSGRHLLFPFPVPVVAPLINRYLGPLPGLDALCLNEFLIARAPSPLPSPPRVSVVVPCKDERGNVEDTIRSVPAMGRGTEVIFVDGHSTDGTVEEIERCKGLNDALDQVRVIVQGDTGKADAVRDGFDAATGDILMILDADNTVRAEELPKFYAALVEGKGELINGSRLVFPMEDQAMRHLNLMANHFFGRLFSWILGQEVSDTLCGTKALSADAWRRISATRGLFGEDPFGDFDLLLGAAKSDLRIREIPVRYRARGYGEIKIDRFRNGLQLFRMAGVGFRAFKQLS